MDLWGYCGGPTSGGDGTEGVMPTIVPDVLIEVTSCLNAELPGWRHVMLRWNNFQLQHRSCTREGMLAQTDRGLALDFPLNSQKTVPGTE